MTVSVEDFLNSTVILQCSLKLKRLRFSFPGGHIYVMNPGGGGTPEKLGRGVGPASQNT